MPGQLGILGLLGQLAGPVQRQVEVAAAVVDLLDLARRQAVVLQHPTGRAIQHLPQQPRPRVAGLVGEHLQRHGEGEELAQGVPPQMVLALELLHVLGRRAPRAGLEQAAALHQRDDREHLGAGAELEDREQVGQVVAQHVAGDRDRVLALAGPPQRVADRVADGEDLDLQAVGVLVGEHGMDRGQQLGVVGPGLVEPEHGGGAGLPGAAHRELDPVHDGAVLGLAGAPDVAAVDLVRQQARAVLVDDAHRPRRPDLERLVVRAVLLGLLGHQPHVGRGAHRRRVQRPVDAAVIDGRRIELGVGVIGNHEQRVLQLTVAVPHLPRGADRGRHRGVDDHVGGNVQVGDAAVGVDHRQPRSLGGGRGDRGADRLTVCGGQ